MALNIFISAIIAIIFLRHVSREDVIKAKNANFFRTFVYLCLTIVAFVLFYKSYQVSTITNMVFVDALRGSEDSEHRTMDTINKIEIYNRFNEMGTYDNKIMSYLDAHSEDSLFRNKGGMYVSIKPSNNPEYPVVNRKKLTPVLKQAIEESLGKGISTIGPMYSALFISTNIPSYIPFYPKAKYSTGIIRDKGKIGIGDVFNTRDSNYINLKLDGKNSVYEYGEGRGLLKDGIATYMILAHEELKKKYEEIFISTYSNITNTINLLTAADLSQYTYVIMAHSEMPLKQIKVNYNIPIEIEDQFAGLNVGSHWFTVNERLLRNDRENGLMIHIKLPTMANIQLIRSLVLTALLTTLFSLFCRNLYFNMANWAFAYHRKNKIRFANIRRQKLFMRYIYTVAILLLAFLLYIIYCVAIGKTFLVNWGTIWYWIIGIALVLITILTIITYFVFKHAVTPVSKKKEKKKREETKKANNSPKKK